MSVTQKGISRSQGISPDSLISEYQIELVALGRSPKTISWYLEILHRYFSFLRDQGLLRPLQQIGRRELSVYVLHLQSSTRWPGKQRGNGDGRKLSPFSVQGHVRAIRAFWGWLLRQDYISKNPMADFPLPKVPQNMVRTVNISEFTTLLHHIDPLTPHGARHRLMLLLLLDAGLRVSELVEITMENVDLANNLIRVVGKGRKERLIPISPTTRKELQHYVSKTRPELGPVDSPYLFPNPQGGHVTISLAQQFLSRLKAKAGLTGLRLHPHVLRHTFGTEYIKNQGNVFALKDIMGHESLATTLKYVHLNPSDLVRDHQKYSPLTNFMSSTSGAPKARGTGKPGRGIKIAGGTTDGYLLP